MATNKGGRPDPHKKLAILARRRRVASAYLDGKAQWEIAVAEEVTQPTISNDLAAIREEWSESALIDFDGRILLELTKLDRIEREAWTAYRKSQQPSRHRTREKTVGGRNNGAVKTTEKREQRSGDPAFLQIALQCADRRYKLLKLLPNDRQEKMRNHGGDGASTPTEMNAPTDLKVNGEIAAHLEYFSALYDRFAAAQEAAGPTPDDDSDAEPVDPD